MVSSSVTGKITEENGAEPTAIGVGAAQLLGWAALAVVNQPLIAAVLPSTDFKVRALHHLYDAGQLLLLGALSLAAVEASRTLASRLRVTHGVARPLATAVVVFLVGLGIAGKDVANLANRTDVPHWLLTTGMALAFAVVLGASQLAPRLQRPWRRWLFAAAGVAVAVANGLTLKADYFAHHFLTAWLAALLLGRAVEGLELPVRARRPLFIALLGAAALSVLSVAVPAKGDVRLRLYELPSSVLAPLTARFLADEQATLTAELPAPYRDSPWFRERQKLGAVPPTRAVALDEAPIVLFFTVDAFRADVMENPEHRAKLPELSRLREESTFFRVARAPTSSTMTTMASVFSGRYFSQLQWGPDKKAPLIEPTPRFPELVAESGVRTFLAGVSLGRIYGRSGVARGFAKELSLNGAKHPATTAVDAIIAELDAAPSDRHLIYSHFIEPHAPYTMGGTKGTPFERYLRELVLVDRQLGRLREYLQTKGLAERTALIIAADHGEGFGEHGTFNHARTAYEELVRVPLFVYLPGRAGRLVDTPVTLMDVGPTVLDLFGLPTPGFWMGQSLLPVVAGRASSLERPVVVDTGGHIQAYCFDDGLKVIFSRSKHTTEAYDLKKDPGELVNLATQGNAAIDARVRVADQFFRGIARAEADGQEITE